MSSGAHRKADAHQAKKDKWAFQFHWIVRSDLWPGEVTAQIRGTTVKHRAGDKPIST